MTSLVEDTITCTVTRFSVCDGELVRTTAQERCSYRIERGYLFLGNSQASAPVEFLREAASQGHDWSAQLGTEPVWVDGSFGGRNYPAITVGAEELLRVLEEQS